MLLDPANKRVRIILVGGQKSAECVGNDYDIWPRARTGAGLSAGGHGRHYATLVRCRLSRANTSRCRAADHQPDKIRGLHFRGDTDGTADGTTACRWVECRGQRRADITRQPPKLESIRGQPQTVLAPATK